MALPGIGPKRGLRNFFFVLAIFFMSKKRFPEIGQPPRILGESLKQHSLLLLQRNTTIAVLSFIL